MVPRALHLPACRRAEDEGPSSSKVGSAAGGTRGDASAAVAAAGSQPEGEHPTQRELDNLQEWVLTQQWLQRQQLGELPGGGGAAAAAQQLQAMQQLWEQGARGLG
jgi:hypothetical protein